MEIVASRILLRILKLKDVNLRYVNWLNDAEVNKFLEVRFKKHTIATTKTFVREMLSDPCNDLYGIFILNGEHIGNIKLGPINRRYQTAQISLFIGDKRYWGKGYATEAILALTRHGFKKLGLKRIEAGCYNSNIGSINAFLKAGYNIEGVRRNQVICNGRRENVFLMGILPHELLD